MSVSLAGTWCQIAHLSSHVQHCLLIGTATCALSGWQAAVQLCFQVVASLEQRGWQLGN